MSEPEYRDAGYRGQVTQEIRAEQDQGPPTSCKQLGQAGVQGPAPTLTPGSGPSVTLFLPVQDVLLGEGVEAPPFLPALALPPAQAVAGVLAAVQGVLGLWQRGQEPCDPGVTSAAHAVTGEEGDGGRTRIGVVDRQRGR